MSSYLLSARLEVAGAADFISDLDNAARAAVSAEQALKGLKGVGVNLDVKGVRDVVGDLERAEKAARATGEELAKLSTPGAINVTGAAQAADDLRRAADAAREADDALRKVDGAKLGQAADEAGRLSKAMSEFGRDLRFQAVDEGVDAVIAGLRAASTEILAFDEAITNAMSIQPQNMPLVDGFRDIARTISKELGTPVSEVAEGFYALASAGLDAEDQLAAIEPVARFAKAGLTDLSDATEKGAQLFSIFKSQGRSMVEILDVLAQASNVSQGDIDSFADSLTNKAGTAAVTFGQSLEDTVGVLAAFAERGIQGKHAGEQYAIVLRDLSIRATKNADEFERMGIKVFDSEGNMRRITEIIPNLQQAFQGLSDTQTTAELTALGFTLRSQQVILNLLAMGDRASYFSERMDQASGVVDRMVTVQLSSLQTALDRLKAFAIDITITGVEKLGEAASWLRDTLEPALRALAPAAEAFAKGFAGIAETAAVLVGGAIVGGIQAVAWALEQIGTFASQHTGAVEAFGTAIGAIAVAAAATSITNMAINFGGPLLTSLAGATGALLNFTREMAVVARSGSILGALQSGWAALGDTIRNNPTAAIGVFVAAMAGMANEVRKNQKDAEGYAESIASAFDTSTIAGMDAAIAKLQEQVPLLDQAGKNARGLGDFMRTTADIVPFIDFKGTSIDLYDASDAAKELAESLQQTRRDADEAVRLVAAFGSGTTALGTFTGDVAGMNKVIEETAFILGVTDGAFQVTEARLRAIGEANNIDFSAPWQEWLPTLVEVGVAQDGLSTSMQRLGVGAQEADALAGSLVGTTDAMGQSAEDAAEQFDALVTAINGMVEGPLAVFSSDTDFQAAMASFVDATKEVGLNLDATTAAGRAVRGELVGLVEQALAWAEAQSLSADGTRDMGIYAQKVGEAREALITLITPLAGSREEAEKLVNQLGLIPETKDVAIAVSEEGATEVKQALDDAAREREANIKIAANLDPATGAIDGWTQTARSTTVTANADVAPADASLTGVTNTPRTSIIGAQAVTEPADVALNNIVLAARTAVIGTVAPNAPQVNTDLNWVGRGRELAIKAFAHANQASYDIDRAADDRYATIYVSAQTIGSTAASLVSGFFSADGGVIDYYANGGMSERHVAQIAPAGSWRVWAEPETGGESYIPLAASKRTRSLDIWRETGRRLGVQGFENGGVTQSATRVLAMQGGGEVNVTIGAGALQVRVDTQVGANPEHLTRLVAEAMAPALEEFAVDLTTAIQRRRA